MEDREMNQREYYYLNEIKQIHGVATSDLIHWGETCQLQLYVMAYGEGLGWEMSEIRGRLQIRDATKNGYIRGLFPVYQQQILKIRKGIPLDALFMTIEEKDKRQFVFDEPFLFTIDDLVIKAEDLKMVVADDNKKLGSKKEDNLHRVIGALLVILNYDKKYKKGDKGINASAIQKRIIKELEDRGYNSTELESIRKETIPRAFEAIAWNKVGDIGEMKNKKTN